MDMINLKKRLRRYWVAHPMSQREFAAVVGLNQATFGRIINHDVKIANKSFYKMEKVLSEWEKQCNIVDAIDKQFNS